MLAMGRPVRIGLAFWAWGCAGLAMGQTCRLPDHYGEFITMERNVHEGQEYFAVQITEAPQASCAAGLVNRDERFVDYLTQNFARNVDRRKLSEIKEDGEMNAAFIRQLQADTAFNAIMQGWADKAADRTQVTDTLSMDELLNVAVKFFSIYKLNEEGRYVGKICVGLNDVAKTEEVRKPHVEAFCFSAIFEHLEEGGLYEEFIQAAKQLYSVNLGIDPEERLLRAQGAMYFLMRDSGSLRKALQLGYEAKKDWLPFVLAGP